MRFEDQKFIIREPFVSQLEYRWRDYPQEIGNNFMSRQVFFLSLNPSNVKNIWRYERNLASPWSKVSWDSTVQSQICQESWIVFEASHNLRIFLKEILKTARIILILLLRQKRFSRFLGIVLATWNAFNAKLTSQLIRWVAGRSKCSSWAAVRIL